MAQRRRLRRAANDAEVPSASVELNVVAIEEVSIASAPALA
jgi:hypothetical protein